MSDPVQNALAAGDDETKFSRQTPGQLLRQCHTGQQLGLGALPFQAHGLTAGRAQAACTGLGQQRLGAAAGCGQRGRRQVDPILGRKLMRCRALQMASDCASAVSDPTPYSCSSSRPTGLADRRQ